MSFSISKVLLRVKAVTNEKVNNNNNAISEEALLILDRDCCILCLKSDELMLMSKAWAL